jgi:hypothetical protein
VLALTVLVVRTVDDHRPAPSSSSALGAPFLRASARNRPGSDVAPRFQAPGIDRGGELLVVALVLVRV